MSRMQEQRRLVPVLEPGRTRRSFPKQFKADAVSLVLDEGRSIRSVANALGLGPSTLAAWVRQARVDRGEREGLTTGERAELAQLRREVAQLRMERDLLKRATAFWVKESGQ
ncbi:MAG: transposase [Acidimicrobiaceae bacterium]|nr:transposase [Acidimicrobiaceae bacterium]